MLLTFEIIWIGQVIRLQNITNDIDFLTVFSDRNTHIYLLRFSLAFNQNMSRSERTSLEKLGVEHSGEGVFGCRSHDAKLFERIEHSGIR